MEFPLRATSVIIFMTSIHLKNFTIHIKNGITKRELRKTISCENILKL